MDVSLTYDSVLPCPQCFRYINSSKKVIFLGMNPGPWGMAQTGVPFGQVNMTKEFLGKRCSVTLLNYVGPKISRLSIFSLNSGITEREVLKPKVEHPKRPVNGFNCNRSEVSGERFWGFFKEECQEDPGRAEIHEDGYLDYASLPLQ